MKQNNLFKHISVTSIWLWLGFFALVPNVLVLITSMLQQGDNELVRLQLTLINYFDLFDTIYVRIFLHSIWLAGLCTFLCLVIGYPFAYILARAHDKHKGLLLLLVIIPFWTSSLIRSYAIVTVLKAKGILNSLLLWMGIIHQPLQLLYSGSAVIVGLVYSLLPFMILPLYANIEKLDISLVDAARDLGATKLTVMRKIILPLTMPGIIAGIMLVFLPAMSMFYIPDLLGGAKTLLVGNLIENQFLAARNWPMGSTVSIILTLLMGLMLLAYWRSTKISNEQQELI